MKNQQIAPVAVADEDADDSIAVANRDRSKRRKTRSTRRQDEAQLDIEALRKQLLWERGLIDPTKVSSYTKDGPKDEEGHRDMTYSLEVLMESRLDFLQEKTSLQKLGESLGVMIEYTPKYHAELAGEGVEYDWGCGKQRYRRQPLARKRTLANFKSLVKECFGRDYLTKSIVRKTARRARAYICAHHWLDNGADGLPDTGEISLAKIEQLSKQMRTHRCAFDFDKGYIVLTSKENAA
jgi:hypothetical protein